MVFGLVWRNVHVWALGFGVVRVRARGLYCERKARRILRRVGVISLVLLADDLAAQAALKKLERGLRAARQGNCAAAIPDLQAVVNENERLVPALNALAVCEAAMGNPDRASAGFERIAKLEPKARQHETRGRRRQWSF